MTVLDTITRQVLTADEVGTIIGQTGSAVRKHVRRNGHVLGVAPVPDTGRRVVFSRVLVERALGLDSQAAAAS